MRLRRHRRALVGVQDEQVRVRALQNGPLLRIPPTRLFKNDVCNPAQRNVVSGDETGTKLSSAFPFVVLSSIGFPLLMLLAVPDDDH